MKGYAKKWRLAATVDSCRTNCQTTGTCSCSHFQLGLTKVLARLSARKKHVLVSGEMSRMMLRGLKDNGFMEETYDQRLCHTSSGSVKKDKFSFLPVCFRLCTKAKHNRKTAQSLKKQYLLPSLGLQCVFVERELQNICWPVWTKVEKQEHTVNAGIRVPVFLADP